MEQVKLNPLEIPLILRHIFEYLIEEYQDQGTTYLINRRQSELLKVRLVNQCWNNVAVELLKRRSCLVQLNHGNLLEYNSSIQYKKKTNQDDHRDPINGLDVCLNFPHYVKIPEYMDMLNKTLLLFETTPQLSSPPPPPITVIKFPSHGHPHVNNLAEAQQDSFIESLNLMSLLLQHTSSTLQVLWVGGVIQPRSTLPSGAIRRVQAPKPLFYLNPTASTPFASISVGVGGAVIQSGSTSAVVKGSLQQSTTSSSSLDLITTNFLSLHSLYFDISCLEQDSTFLPNLIHLINSSPNLSRLKLMELNFQSSGYPYEHSTQDMITKIFNGVQLTRCSIKELKLPIYGSRTYDLSLTTLDSICKHGFSYLTSLVIYQHMSYTTTNIFVKQFLAVACPALTSLQIHIMESASGDLGPLNAYYNPIEEQKSTSCIKLKKLSTLGLHLTNSGTYKMKYILINNFAVYSAIAPNLNFITTNLSAVRIKLSYFQKHSNGLYLLNPNRSPNLDLAIGFPAVTQMTVNFSSIDESDQMSGESENRRWDLPEVVQGFKLYHKKLYPNLKKCTLIDKDVTETEKERRLGFPELAQNINRNTIIELFRSIVGLKELRFINHYGVETQLDL